MKTIIQVMGMNSTKFGGLERFMLALIDLCVDCKFILVYNSMPKSDIYLNSLRKRNVIVLECDCSRLNFIDRIQFSQKLLSYKPSIVHFHFYSDWIISLVLRLFSRARQYRSVRSCISTEFQGRLGWLRKLKNKISWYLSAISIDKFIAVSRYVESQLEFYSLKNVMTIYHGVAPYLSESVHIDKNKKVVTCLGFASPVKGIDVFIKSLPHIMYSDYEAWIIGLDETSDYTQSLHHLAQELGVHDRIRWIGIVDNVCEYVRVSDVFCQTSRSEALSLAACEALMLGCPVIGSNVGGLPEVAQLTFESENSEQLAKLIDGVLIDDDYRNRLSREAETKWEHNFQLVNGAKAYRDLYLKYLA